MKNNAIARIEYPYNLLHSVFTGCKEFTLPEDVEEALDFLLSEFSEREKELVRLRFIECKKLKEIAPLIGYKSVESVSNLERRVVLKLRHQSRIGYLQNGLAKQRELLAQRAVERAKKEMSD